MKKLFLLIIVCIVGMTMNAQLIKNNFLVGYKVTDVLEKGSYPNTLQDATSPIMINQWNLAGKTGTNDQNPANPTVTDPLSYTGYIDSGKDVSIILLKLASGGRTSIYSLAGDNTYGAGTYYLAVMINLSSATTTAADFVSFDGNYTGNAQRCRITVKGVDANTFQLGMGDSGVATTFGSTNLNFGQTYLAVVKFTVVGDGTGTCWLFINPDVTLGEPTTSFATSAITGTAVKAIRGLVIRQRSTLAGQVGGFRFASSWSSSLGIGTGISQIEKDSKGISAFGKTILTRQSGSLKVFSLTGLEVLSSKTDGKLETTLSKGLYMVRFVGSDGKVESAKVEIK